MKSGEEGIVRRRSGISRTIFAISLVVVAAASGITGYFLAGVFTPAQQSTTLNGAGATFPFPLFSAIAANYTGTHPNTKVNYQSIGSGGGIRALTDKTVDFAASDAPLNSAQRTAAPNTLHIPATIGSVVFAYNLVQADGTTAIPEGLNLTGPILAGIYLGSITKWNDASIQSINPGVQLPDQTIIAVHRSDGSGTTFVWTSYLSIVSSTWNTTVGKGTAVSWPATPQGGLGAAGNEGVAGVIRGTTYTGGYVELAYALQNNMAHAYIQNQASSYIAPSLASTQAALNDASATLPAGDQSWSSVELLDSTDPAAYPIASFSYILVYKELNVVPNITQEKAKALVDYLFFVVHDGQTVAPNLQYVPLPSSVVNINDNTIRSITFNGQTLLG